MSRFFNTMGPCQAGRHYMLPPLRRLPELRELIEGELYFIVHAPRQVGKTTMLMALATELTAEGDYAAVLVSAEQGRAFPDDIGGAEVAILGEWAAVGADLPEPLRPPTWGWSTLVLLPWLAVRRRSR